jgi:hypothetical protein
MNFTLRISLIMMLCLIVGKGLFAQEVEEEDHSYKPLTLKLNDDGSKYIRFLMWHQIWAETNNLSNGSDFSVTPSIRRSRFLAFAQISPKFMILTHWGLNSLNPNNMTSLGSNGDAPQLFLHDAWGEFKLNDALYIGGGLHYWKGMTRLSNQSTLNMMTLDQARPFAHWHSLGNTDQFARHMGVYAKGTIAKSFQYRVAVNKRIAPANSLRGATSYNGDTTVSITGSGNGVIEGYLEYQFWDKESNKLPYKVGTYLGTKKVLNIGAGFFAQPNGALNKVTGEDQNVAHFAADIFLELPTSEGNAFSAYASFMRFNYGENFVGRWAGTGTNIYAHAGYYIKAAKLMPYVAFQNGNYDGFSDPVQSLDIGANYYVNGHHAKLTLEYHSITNQLSDGISDVSQLRLQMHVFL